MNWFKKLICECDMGLNRCLGTPGSSMPSHEQLMAPALFRAGAPCGKAIRLGPCLNAVVIDQSGSMADSDFQPSRIDAAKNAVIAFVDKRRRVSPVDYLSLIGFNDEAEVHLRWTGIGDHWPIENALQRMEADGGTELSEGLLAASKMFSKVKVDGYTRRILMLTDGYGGSPNKLADRLKTQGALIQVIGIGGSPSAVNEEVLKAIATTDNTGFTHYWFISDSQSLVEHYEQLSTGIVLNRR